MHDWNDASTWAVLLVDDEIDNLEVVAETLQFFGATVKTADGGTAALELLKTFTPTLIVTDLSMPGVDGWQLRVKIKALPDAKDIPVVALSAHAMIGDRERALSAGFDGYLTKPIDVPTLIPDLRAAIQHHLTNNAVSVTETVTAEAVTVPEEDIKAAVAVRVGTQPLAPDKVSTPTTPVIVGTPDSNLRVTQESPVEVSITATQERPVAPKVAEEEQINRG